MFRQAAAPALVFSKMPEEASLFEQTLDTRQESEVMDKGKENLTCPGRL